MHGPERKQDVKEEHDLAYMKERDQFFQKLQEFHKARGTPFQRIPTFGGQPLDLYALYNTVVSFGGICVVTEKKKWGQVFRALGFPPCTNAAYALKQHYSRYLEVYERIYFHGEDTEDTASSRTYAQMLKYRRMNKASKHGPLGEPLVDNFNRISFSLQSGLQNEVDFALNICSLLSNVPNSIFNLAKCPAILDLMLGHVGIWSKEEFHVKFLHEEWYTKSNKDFNKFWRNALNEPIAYELYEQDSSDLSVVDKNTTKMFVDKDDIDAKSPESCRINQVSVILYNFSFEQMNAMFLASHNPALRFLLMASCCNHSNIQRASLDALDNIASNITLEGMECAFTQNLLQILDKFLGSNDKFRRCGAMSIIAKLAMKESNKEVLRDTLYNDVYKSLVETLYLPDIALILASLDTLYCLTKLDETIATNIAKIHGSINILVCLITVRAETYGNKAIKGFRIIENKHSMFTPKNQRYLKEQEKKRQIQQNQYAYPPRNNDMSPRNSMPKGMNRIPSSARHMPPGMNPAALYAMNQRYGNMNPQYPQYPPNQNINLMKMNYPPGPPGPPIDKPISEEFVEIDPATYTANWMSGYYKPHPSNMLYTEAIYEDYISCCKEIKRQGVLSLPEFIKVLRSIIPPSLAQILPPDSKGKVGISGIVRREKPMPVQNKVSRPVPRNMEQQMPPGYNAHSKGMSPSVTPSKQSHLQSPLSTPSTSQFPFNLQPKQLPPHLLNSNTSSPITSPMASQLSSKTFPKMPSLDGEIPPQSPSQQQPHIVLTSKKDDFILGNKDDHSKKGESELPQKDTKKEESMEIDSKNNQSTTSKHNDAINADQNKDKISVVNNSNQNNVDSDKKSEECLQELEKNYFGDKDLSSAPECEELIEKLKAEMQQHFTQFHIHRQQMQTIQMQIQQLVQQTQTDNLPQNIVKNIQLRLQSHHVQMQAHYQRIQQLNALSEQVQSKFSKKTDENGSTTETSSKQSLIDTLGSQPPVTTISQTESNMADSNDTAQPTINLNNNQPSAVALSQNLSLNCDSAPVKKKGKQFIVPPPVPFMQNNIVSIQHGIPNSSFNPNSDLSNGKIELTNGIKVPETYPITQLLPGKQINNTKSIYDSSPLTKTTTNGASNGDASVNREDLDESKHLDEAKPSKESKSSEEEKTSAESKPEETKPSEESKPSEETKPSEVTKLSEETKPSEESKPSEELKNSDEAKQLGELKQSDETTEELLPPAKKRKTTKSEDLPMDQSSPSNKVTPSDEASSISMSETPMAATKSGLNSTSEKQQPSIEPSNQSTTLTSSQSNAIKTISLSFDMITSPRRKQAFMTNPRDDEIDFVKHDSEEQVNDEKSKTENNKKQAMTESSGATETSLHKLYSFYYCEWESCKMPPFQNVTGLLTHMIMMHAPLEGHLASCKVPGCSSIKKPRRVMICHFQEKHCLRRNKDGYMSSVPLPKIDFPKNMEWKFEDESPVTRSVRHTAALILRNIARISMFGKKLILPYEDQLALVAISPSEAASSVAECLIELSRLTDDLTPIVSNGEQTDTLEGINVIDNKIQTNNNGIINIECEKMEL